MPDPYERPCLDTSVYIAHFKGEVSREDSGRVLQRAERNEFRIINSTFVRVELVRPPGGTVDEIAEEEISRFFQREMFVWVEVDLAIARKAAALARSLRMRPADAVHLATAIVAGADVLFAWDTGFPLGETVEGVRVSVPYVVGQMDFGEAGGT